MYFILRYRNKHLWSLVLVNLLFISFISLFFMLIFTYDDKKKILNCTKRYSQFEINCTWKLIHIWYFLFENNLRQKNTQYCVRGKYNNKSSYDLKKRRYINIRSSISCAYEGSVCVHFIENWKQLFVH